MTQLFESMYAQCLESLGDDLRRQNFPIDYFGMPDEETFTCSAADFFYDYQADFSLKLVDGKMAALRLKSHLNGLPGGGSYHVEIRVNGIETKWAYQLGRLFVRGVPNSEQLKTFLETGEVVL